MVIYNNVYEPSDDTWFIMNILNNRLAGSNLKFINCIDLGCGSGILGIYLLKKRICEKVVFIDSNLLALENTLENTVLNKIMHKSILLHSYSNELDLVNIFDLVVANPPYLPGEPVDLIDSATLTGSGGFETIVSFIEVSHRFLRENGFLYIAYSSLSNIDIVEDTLNKYFRVINKFSNRFFLEEIYVVEALKK